MMQDETMDAPQGAQEPVETLPEQEPVAAVPVALSAPPVIVGVMIVCCNQPLALSPTQGRFSTCGTCARTYGLVGIQMGELPRPGQVVLPGAMDPAAIARLRAPGQ